MNCQELEREVALLAGGDLEEVATVELHLAACADCRALLDDLRAVRAGLAELREIELPARRSRRWWWAAGAIAAGLALFLIPRPAEIAPPRVVAWAPPPPAVVAIAPRPRPAARVKPRPAPAPDTEFAKILTDDEDVVILWAMNSKGELR